MICVYKDTWFYLFVTTDRANICLRRIIPPHHRTLCVYLNLLGLATNIINVTILYRCIDKMLIDEIVSPIPWATRNTVRQKGNRIRTVWCGTVWECQKEKKNVHSRFLNYYAAFSVMYTGEPEDVRGYGCSTRVRN